MTIEWVAQTDVFVCVNCGKTFSEGQRIVGDFDEFYHKENGDCEDYKD